MNEPQHRAADPEYVYGQILALRALILGIADLTMDGATFRDRSLQGLERLRTAVLPSNAADSMLLAIDQTEAWVRAVTPPGT